MLRVLIHSPEGKAHQLGIFLGRPQGILYANEEYHLNTTPFIQCIMSS